MAPPARRSAASALATGLCVAALLAVSLPRGAVAVEEATVFDSTPSSKATDFSFMKGLVLASAEAKAAKADGSVGLMDGLFRNINANTPTTETGDETDKNVLGSALLLNRIRAQGDKAMRGGVAGAALTAALNGYAPNKDLMFGNILGKVAQRRQRRRDKAGPETLVAFFQLKFSLSAQLQLL